MAERDLSEGERATLRRWRLVLGKSANALDSASGASAEDLARDAALDWLYERDTALGERDIRGADLGSSALSVPKWINSVHQLFPKETIERLEREAVEEFGLHEVVTNKEVLSRIEPSETLLRAVLLTRHLMNDEVLGLARELVRKVVAQLMESLAKTVRTAFSGARARRRSRHRSMRNFDARATVRANLQNFDPKTRQLVIEQPLFVSRSKRHGEKWQIIIVVDQVRQYGQLGHSRRRHRCVLVGSAGDQDPPRRVRHQRRRSLRSGVGPGGDAHEGAAGRRH
jgi:hypothetical protein